MIIRYLRQLSYAIDSLAKHLCRHDWVRLDYDMFKIWGCQKCGKVSRDKI